MNRMSLPDAISAWRDALGPDNVCTDEAGLHQWCRNVTGLERDVPAVLRPGSTEDVQQLVVIAAAHNAPLYPISCGRNWGFGSRLPVRDHCAVVDLSRMNRIHEVNVDHHFAVIEPGVTQQQLYAHLRDHQLPLVLNVTGSSAQASVIGNALDRGIGYFASRADELSGLEVVLADGRLLKTGFGHYPESRLTHLYRYGHGPRLDGLFSQSSLGIVTRAGVRLMPEPSQRVAMICRLADDRLLTRYVDALAGLYRDGVVQSVTHIGNSHRTEIALAPLIRNHLAARGTAPENLDKSVRAFLRAEGYSDWSGITGIQGTREMVRARIKELKRGLRGIARPSIISPTSVGRMTSIAKAFRWMPWFDRKLAVIPSLASLQSLAAGIPTSEYMKSVYSATGEEPPTQEEADPDHSPCGLIYFAPMMPLDGATCQEASALIKEIFSRQQFVPYATFNIIDSQNLEAVISVSFNRQAPNQREKAEEIIDALHREFRANGWLPYRLGIGEMSNWVRAGDCFWDVAEQIKSALDPDGILSPGRYSL